MSPWRVLIMVCSENPPLWLLQVLFFFRKFYCCSSTVVCFPPPTLFPPHPSHPPFLPLIQVLKVTLAVVSMQKESIEILFNNHQGLFIYLNAWWKTLIMQILLLYRSGKCSLISESEYKRFQEGSMRAWSRNVWTFAFL